MARPKRKASALIIHPLVPLAKASKVLRIEQSILVEKLLAGEILGENRTTELSKSDKKALKKSGEPDSQHWFIYASEFNRLLDERLAQYERRISTDGLDQFFTSPEFRLDNKTPLDLPESLKTSASEQQQPSNSNQREGEGEAGTDKSHELADIAEIAVTAGDRQTNNDLIAESFFQFTEEFPEQNLTAAGISDCATNIAADAGAGEDAHHQALQEAPTEITLINVYEPQQIPATMDGAIVVAELVQHLRDEIAYRHNLESRIEELAAEVAYLRSEIMQRPADNPLKRLGTYLRLFFRDVKALYQ